MTKNDNVHYITDAADTSLNLALYFAANHCDCNQLTQLAHDVICQSVNLISNDPQRNYLDPKRSIIIEWASNQSKR